MVRARKWTSTLGHHPAVDMNNLMVKLSMPRQKQGGSSSNIKAWPIAQLRLAPQQAPGEGGPSPFASLRHPVHGRTARTLLVTQSLAHGTLGSGLTRQVDQAQRGAAVGPNHSPQFFVSSDRLSSAPPARFRTHRGTDQVPRWALGVSDWGVLQPRSGAA